MMQEEMHSALQMMNTIKPCSPENARAMVPPAPTNYIEAFDPWSHFRQLI